MIDVSEKKGKIISFLNSVGPSIPVRISKAIDMDPVFASAILSELLNEKRIKTSHMKMGSSPFYLVPGQEIRLEEHSDKLKSVEKETYNKLKEKMFLLDEEQIPATRVALRSLKDFAVPLKFEGKLYWRYAFISEENVISSINNKSKPREEIIEEKLDEIKKSKIIDEKEEKSQEPTKKEEKIEKKQKKEEKIENIFEDTEEDSDISLIVKEYLNKKNIELIDKIQSDKKEFIAKVKVPTAIGPINFLLIAKNKKTTNRDEINSALQRAKYHQMPCIYLIRKEPQKSLKTELESNNLIKVDII